MARRPGRLARPGGEVVTGPEHYVAAERYLRTAEAADDVATTQSLAAIAQGHALLAATAATVEAELWGQDYHPWEAALARRPGDAS